jgi:hypothetical protein
MISRSFKVHDHPHQFARIAFYEPDLGGDTTGGCGPARGQAALLSPPFDAIRPAVAAASIIMH